MIRVYFGTAFLLIGIPLFIYCLVDHSTPPGAFIASALITATGVALHWPQRWLR